MSLVKDNIKDPTAWVAFIGFVLGGVQSILGSAKTTLTADQMGNLMLMLGMAGMVIRGIETYFVRRSDQLKAAADKLVDDANIRDFKDKKV